METTLKLDEDEVKKAIKQYVETKGYEVTEVNEKSIEKAISINISSGTDTRFGHQPRKLNYIEIKVKS